jgi:type 1 fimbriae regulatory protein FimB/type 1 fimbriae regulatory protein FimE
VLDVDNTSDRKSRCRALAIFVTLSRAGRAATPSGACRRRSFYRFAYPGSGRRMALVRHLRWDQVDLKTANLHVRRVKSGTPSTHPLTGVELRALRRLRRETKDSPAGLGPFVFVSERGSPFTTAGFAMLVQRAAVSAGLEIKAHPHMLRHACGYALAIAGHDTRALQAYLGHRNIEHTVRYTELAPDRFKGFWRD